MPERFREWFSRPPPGSPPAETLRWVRRVAVGTLPLGLLIFGQAWAFDDTLPLWLPLGAVILLALSPASVTLAIRAAEREAAKPGYRPPHPDDERRRERRATYALVGILCVAFPIVGYFVDGPPSAIFFSAGAAISSILAILWQRRYWNR